MTKKIYSPMNNSFIALPSTGVDETEYKGDAFFTPPHSIVQDSGDIVDQLITFKDGIKKYVRGVKTKTIISSGFTSYNTVDGRQVLVNDKNVLCVEVFKGLTK